MNKTHLLTEESDFFQETRYYSACGLGSWNIDSLSYNKEEVTCENCKLTHSFKNPTLSYQELEVIKEMVYNSTLINLEESGLL